MDRFFENGDHKFYARLIVLLCFMGLSGCFGSQSVKQSFPTVASLEVSSCKPVIYNKDSSSAPKRPPWALLEPPDKGGMHYLVGMSNFHATERDARGAAMQHARSEFAKYTGVEITELDEISREIYGKASGILDPTVTGKSQSTQETDALVRRTRAKEWYFEKLMQSCRGKDMGIAYQYWVLAEVPSEEYDKVQEWKEKRIARREAKKTAVRKEVEDLLERLTASHQKTFAKVEIRIEKADPIGALGLLQADLNRLYNGEKSLKSKEDTVSSVVARIKSLQREVPGVVQRIRSSLIIDPGRGAAVWIPSDDHEGIEIPVWVWNRKEDQITPVSDIPLLLKKNGGTVPLSRGRTDPNGRLTFRLDEIEAGEYAIAFDSQDGTLVTLDPILKETMAVVASHISVVAYSPNITGAVKFGIHQLFRGPAFKPLPVKKVVMGSARYGETRQGSAFGRRLEKEIEREIVKMSSITFIRRKDRRSPRALSVADRSRGITLSGRPEQAMSSPAMQAVLDGADASLEIKYSLEGGIVKIDLRLIQAKTGKTVAAAGTSLDRSQVPEDLELIPPHSGETFGKMPSKPGNIALELTTQRGDGATFAEGERMICYVSTNRDAYLLLIYLDAKGNLIQIFPNSKSGEGYQAAGEYLAIPDESDAFDFSITLPFGIEQVWAFASTEPFPFLQGNGLSNGLTVLDQNLSELASVLRTHGERRGIAYGEANVVLTTVKD